MGHKSSQSSAVLNIGGDHSLSPAYVSLIVAGGFGALDAAFLLCRAPRAPLTFASHGVLFLHALMDVFSSAFAGVLASLLAWSRGRSDARLPHRLVILASAAASVWAPCIVLFFRQDSPWMLPFSVLAAFVLALCWRKILPFAARTDLHETSRREMFSETLQPLPPWNRSAPWLALCVYAGVAEIVDRDVITASGLLMIAGFGLSWQSIQPVSASLSLNWMRRQARKRLMGNAAGAVLTTYIALNAWNPNTDASVAQAAAMTAQKDPAPSQQKPMRAGSAIAMSRYQSIVLWAIPQEKKFVLPPPPGMVTAIDHLKEPMVIPFTGAYWYFQAPHTGPGPLATIARGSPLLANVHSTNDHPLLMEAHQSLGTSVSLACCRSVRLEFQSCDNFPGDTLLGIALNDTHAKPKSAPNSAALFLGSQPVFHTASSHLMAGCVPLSQAMEFAIPHPAALRRFNEITVFFSTDPTRSEIGAKVALKQFELLPR